MSIQWKDEYSVKVEKIDDQHKKIFSFLDIVDSAIKGEGDNINLDDAKEIVSDPQHKKLFGMIDEVGKAIVSKEDGLKQKLQKTIKEMTEYAVYHFDTEEALFHKFDYPKTEEHVSQHEGYKVNIAAFQKELNKIKEDDMAEFAYKLLDFIQDWWVGHILHADMKYSKFFNEHGVK